MLSKGGVLVRPGEYLIDDGNDKFCAGLNSRLFDPKINTDFTQKVTGIILLQIGLVFFDFLNSFPKTLFSESENTMSWEWLKIFGCSVAYLDVHMSDISFMNEVQGF